MNYEVKLIKCVLRHSSLVEVLNRPAQWQWLLATTATVVMFHLALWLCAYFALFGNLWPNPNPYQQHTACSAVNICCLLVCVCTSGPGEVSNFFNVSLHRPSSFQWASLNLCQCLCSCRSLGWVRMRRGQDIGVLCCTPRIALLELQSSSQCFHSAR